MTRILITGISGLLGINLALEAAKEHDVVGVLHESMLKDPGFETIQADLLDADVISNLLDQTEPDWVINCAALADLDACEQQPGLAQRLNAELPGRLAAEAAKRGSRFLQVSTDAVFDGIKGDYDEEDAPTPVSVYGRTKRLAELGVKAAHPHALIVRPVFFGWSVSGDRSLVEFFYNNLSLGSAVPGFVDRLFCPLLVNDLAQIMLQLLHKNQRGLYHVVSSDHMSKYDFGVGIAQRFDLDSNLIHATKTASANTAAQRSLNLTLRTTRLSKILGHRLPTIELGIERLYEQHQSGYRAQLRTMAVIPELAKG